MFVAAHQNRPTGGSERDQVVVTGIRGTYGRSLVRIFDERRSFRERAEEIAGIVLGNTTAKLGVPERAFEFREHARRHEQLQLASLPSAQDFGGVALRREQG